MKQTPKYALIEQDFIKKIQSGELEAGAELPSESDLIQLYQVSRVTVRRAIDELYHQGYIEKMQGKRTCVKGKVKLQELTSISSYTEEIIRQGMTPSRKLLTDNLRVCTDEEAALLNLQKADPVFHMKRIYFADGTPVGTDDPDYDTNQTRTIYRNSDGYPLVIYPNGDGSWCDDDGNTYTFSTDEDVYDENGGDYYYGGEPAYVRYMPKN